MRYWVKEKFKYALSIIIRKINICDYFKIYEEKAPIEEKNRQAIIENLFSYEKIDRNEKTNAVLFGYWQSEKYFYKYRNDLLKLFVPKHEYSNEVKKYIKKIIENECASIHIRRGDYVTLNLTIDIDYYNRAIEYIFRNNKVNIFYIFSDDIEWVKNNLNHKQNIYYIYVSLSEKSVTKDIDEMMLMSMCSHNIIANSTYSWWGAWLNRNKKKVVISPKVAFNNKDIIPDDWIRL